MAAEGNADHSPHNTQEGGIMEEEQVRMLMIRAKKTIAMMI